MRTLFAAILVVLCGASIAQTTPGVETKKLYDALNNGDSLTVLSFLSKDVVIQHYEKDTSFALGLEQFMTIIPKFKSGLYREEFEITVETGYPGTSIVNVDFRFFLDGKFHHCGKDVVVWKSDIGKGDEPKIAELHSYECECELSDNPLVNKKDWMVKKLNTLLDAWHEAAANANFEQYFGFMADDFYYLGTDPSERWSKEQFANFSKPYFDKGEAWSFTAFDRNFYFSPDHSVIWFDEKLNTWMEECRGSGVIVFEKLTNGEHGYGGFKLKHYNLTVTIENDKIQDFIKLRKK